MSGFTWLNEFHLLWAVITPGSLQIRNNLISLIYTERRCVCWEWFNLNLHGTVLHQHILTGLNWTAGGQWIRGGFMLLNTVWKMCPFHTFLQQDWANSHRNDLNWETALNIPHTSNCPGHIARRWEKRLEKMHKTWNKILYEMRRSKIPGEDHMEDHMHCMKKGRWE